MKYLSIILIKQQFFLQAFFIKVMQTICYAIKELSLH